MTWSKTDNKQNGKGSGKGDSVKTPLHVRVAQMETQQSEMLKILKSLSSASSAAAKKEKAAPAKAPTYKEVAAAAAQPKTTEDEVICPACHTSHTNLNKKRCRACNAWLAPRQQVEYPKLSDRVLPKDPLSTQFAKTLLLRVGLRDLVDTSAESPAAAAADDMDTSGAPAQKEPTDDDSKTDAKKSTLEHAQSVLETLEKMGAENDLIKAAKAKVDSFPKPKPPAESQPLRDYGTLANLMAQKVDHVKKQEVEDQAEVDKCQAALEAAQKALEQALENKAENARKAEEAMTLIQQKLAKEAVENQQVAAMLQSSASDHDTSLQALVLAANKKLTAMGLMSEDVFADLMKALQPSQSASPAAAAASVSINPPAAADPKDPKDLKEKDPADVRARSRSPKSRQQA